MGQFVPLQSLIYTLLVNCPQQLGTIATMPLLCLHSTLHVKFTPVLYHSPELSTDNPKKFTYSHEVDAAPLLFKCDAQRHGSAGILR